MTAETKRERSVRAGEKPAAGAALSPNAGSVLAARYLRRDGRGNIIETPGQLFARVAEAIASAERSWSGPEVADQWRQEFLRLMTALEFLPGSPVLMNAGTPLNQLNACFVVPVPDTIEGIFDALRTMALIQRSGGGTGFSFSRLRPHGDTVASTGSQSSGPVSFMRIFDCATENIRQGGRRRGANMGVLRIDHPDIREFIGAKRDGTSLGNFNLSVGITDDFMRALAEGKSFALRHPGTGQVVAHQPAAELFAALVDAAWSTGDPGLLFLDTLNRANPTPQLGPIEATNPCGEVPLLPFEACNLGSINLARMLRPNQLEAAIDWDRLAHTVRASVRFLDNVVEVGSYPTPEIERRCRGNRKLGLGVMGFAELLIRLGVSYDSPAAVTLAEQLMRFINDTALEASRALAGERGVFPNWPGSVYEARGLRVRNATRTAIAPTGTIGIIAGTTPGIEPLFALAYRRVKVLGGRTLVEINSLLFEALDRRGIDAEQIRKSITRSGRLSGLAGVPADMQRLFVTALDIAPRRQLEVVAAFQRHVDNAVSKTVNLPQDATPADVAEVFRTAATLGLKGVTVYRHGSKTSQVLELGVAEEPGLRDHASRCDPGECAT